jgi:hypothetical protein
LVAAIRNESQHGRPKWGGIVVSGSGVWRCLRRHGLNTRAKRLALVAGYRAPYEPPRAPEPERHIDVERPGELVGMDCFFVGRLRGTQGAVWQLTAIDVRSAFASAELVSCPQGQPTGAHLPPRAARGEGPRRRGVEPRARALATTAASFETIASAPRSVASGRAIRASTPGGADQRPRQGAIKARPPCRRSARWSAKTLTATLEAPLSRWT